MIGILYLVAGIAYLLVVIYVFKGGWRIGFRNGSTARAIVYSVLASLATLLPVFWDVVPTILMHQRYCAEDAGLFVYQEPAQWATQHSAEADALKISRTERKELRSTTTDDGWDRSLINRRVANDSRNSAVTAWLDIEKKESRLVDIQTGEVLVLFRDYRAGKQIPNQSIRPQAYLPYCESNKSFRQHDKFTHYFSTLEFAK